MDLFPDLKEVSHVPDNYGDGVVTRDLSRLKVEPQNNDEKVCLLLAFMHAH